MTKPHWQKLHEWALSDIRFELEQIWQLKLLLRKHPSDRMGEILRDMIKIYKKFLSAEVESYKKIYGDKPDVIKMRREVEAGD